MTLIEQIISVTIPEAIILAILIVADVIIQIQINKLEKQDMED